MIFKLLLLILDLFSSATVGNSSQLLDSTNPSNGGVTKFSVFQGTRCDNDCNYESGTGCVTKFSIFQGTGCDNDCNYESGTGCVGSPLATSPVAQASLNSTNLELTRL